MDRKELRRRLAARPRSVHFAELERLLLAYGWHLDRISGDHYIYAHEGLRLPVPFRRGSLLPVYVRKALQFTEGQDDD